MRVKKNEFRRNLYSDRLSVRNEGKLYIREAEENEESEKEDVDFTNLKILEEIEKVIKKTGGIKDKFDISKENLKKDELNFKYNDKDGSIKRNGYMLNLKIDGMKFKNGSDEKEVIGQPIPDMKDKSTTTFVNAVIELLKKCNKLVKESSLQKVLNNYRKDEDHCMVCKDGVCKPCADDHCCGMGLCDNCRGDDALSKVKEPLYYILVGDRQNPSKGIPVFWTEVVGDENGYPERGEAVLAARDLLRHDFNKARHAYGVAGKVDARHFMDNSFWDSLDNNEIPVVWDSSEDPDLQDEVSRDMMDNPYDVVPMDSTDSMNDFGDMGASENYKNPVFMDVAKTKLMEKLGDSLILIPDSKKECMNMDDPCKEDPNMFLICLSPSYAISPLSNIAVPVSFTDGMISLPMADMPDPEVVFDGNYTENAMKDYDAKVQDFIFNDAPKSDLIEVNLDNIDDAKARVVDVINSMAENYQNNKSKLENLLDLHDEDILKEARYYLVPKNEKPQTREALEKVTPMGFEDLKIARSSMPDFTNEKYPDGLAILDTHYSDNNEKWEIL